MELAVAERPFSQEQHAGQLQSWRNVTDDRRDTNLQNSSQGRDPRRWAVWDRNHMSNSNINGKDIQETRGPSSVCRDNLRGKCSRGSFCKFQHVDSDGAGYYRSGQWNLGPTSEPSNSQSFGGSKDGDSYRRSPCRNFQRGNCYRGSTCPYLHPQSTEFSSTGVDNSSGRPFFRESRERLPCRNFQNGCCYRGSSCAYLHSELSEADRLGQQHRIVTTSRNFGFHEGSVNNTFKTSQVHGVANKENDSRSSFSREPQRRSPCRNYLNGRCHFGSSCRRWHPDTAHGNNCSAETSNNHDLPRGHQYNNLRTVPKSRSPCHFIHRGNGYQGTPSANLHSATVYERTRYDLSAGNHQVTATSRDLNFDRGNVVREVNNQGMPGSAVSEDINTSVPKTGNIGDVLVSDHPVEEQGNETVTVKVLSTMVDLSSADTRDGSLLGITDSSTLPAPQFSDVAILSSRRKLLVLDVNGLLADIVSDFPDRFKPDTIVGGKRVFKRPFCDNFLDFCFEKFDVGIWSSRTEKNVTSVLDCLMKNTKDKLLFCWHQSHCTQTGYKTVENNDKPLVLKELKKLWEKPEKDLPWKKGFYNETNTILLDDSPYKALRNPPYTAIFPFPYTFRKVGDNSLGPDGDLRLYLERLAEAENVQKLIQENPFGQRPITKTNLSWTSWRFYSKIAGDYANPQEPVTNTSSNSSEVNDASQILLSLNPPAQPLG